MHGQPDVPEVQLERTQMLDEQVRPELQLLPAAQAQP
jgi:hypothetical protein